jgi:4-amino-4-deoxy-L-arabinose transferase-like glycosyltransferase
MERSGRLWAVLLLLVSLGLNAWMVTWGLPSTAGWAPDEILPSAVLEAKARGFSGGWFDKYPPLHFRLLGAVYAPMTGTVRANAPVPSDVYDRLFLAGRWVSVVMAVGLALLVYLCGRRLLDEAGALFAAAIVAVMAPFVFYAKLANVDIPYLFWWALSLVFLIRALETHKALDYLGLGVAAALAIGTKDQAYGLYVLVAPLLVWSRKKRNPGKGWLRAIFSPELMLAVAAGALVLQAIYGLPGNVEGLRAHLRLITGSASRDFQEFPNSVAGHAALLWSTILNTAFVMGVPAFLAALVGVVLAARKRDGRLLVLLVPAVSYYPFFMMVALYCYDRFVLPLAILLAYFAGDVLGRMVRHDTWGRVAAGLVLIYGLARAASVDLLLARDSRFAAEEWLRQNAGEARVAFVGPPEYLPRPPNGINVRTLGPSTDRLEKVAPDIVVTNADYAERAEDGGAEQALYKGLEAGNLGYRRVWAYRFRAPYMMIRSEYLADRPGQPLRSNLDKVNPEIRIYERETRDDTP